MVGRQEIPVDPCAPYADIAYGLRALKRAEDVSYRAIAKRAHYSAAVMCEAASGSRLPTLHAVLAFVGACGGASATARWTT